MTAFSENHQRHYFRVPLPEGLATIKQDTCEAFMDVQIVDVRGTGPVVQIIEWGVIFDGTIIQPTWVTLEQLDKEKLKVNFRIA